METKRPTTPAAEEILGGYFPVLDHGFVALVDYMGGDEDIERAARVSYGYGTRKTSQTRGLVRYLRRHHHTTPSEMVDLKFHCAMPMFVARQWIRHRTACLAEGTEVYFDLPGSGRRVKRQRKQTKGTGTTCGSVGMEASTGHSQSPGRSRLTRSERTSTAESFRCGCRRHQRRKAARSRSLRPRSKQGVADLAVRARGADQCMGSDPSGPIRLYTRTCLSRRGYSGTAR